jgi:hypothetical protein
MRRFSCLLTALGTLAGCSVTQSADLATSGMAASITVTADDSGTANVTTRLSTDANSLDSIQLSAGDTLVASAGSQSQSMSYIDVLDDLVYSATFQGAGADGTAFNVALNRSRYVSAPSSTVTLPKPFNVTAPASTATFSRTKDDITVTYDTTGTSDPMTWSVSSECSNGGSGTVANDAGTFVIAKGSLVAQDPKTQAMTCQLSITLKRTRTGSVDRAYGYGGTITAAQQRTVNFNSAP